MNSVVVKIVADTSAFDAAMERAMAHLVEWDIARCVAERLLNEFLHGHLPTQITRDDGLTDEEGVVADALVEAVEAYGALPVQHPNERDEFAGAIHRLQDLLALRVARRAFPIGWPVKS